MTRTLETKLQIADWDEKPYRELPDGRRFTRAEVRLTGSAGEGLAAGAFEALMYYRADGTGTYVTLMSLDATLGGRAGGKPNLSFGGGSNAEALEAALGLVPARLEALLAPP